MSGHFLISMIPEFPQFKKLEFSDKKDVEAFTSQYPPYSDFNFTSMWAWDINGEMELSQLHKNLVVKFCDYLTSKPFYSFLGSNNLSDTVQKLLDRSVEKGGGLELRLVPEDSIKSLDSTRFRITEDRDHFDYIYSIDELKSYEGSSYETKRNNFNRFIKKYPTVSVKILDLVSNETQKKITDLEYSWLGNKTLQKKNPESENEFKALSRLFSSQRLDLVALGFYFDEKLVAFCISEVFTPDYAVSHFAKANVNFSGIYAYLMKENTKFLSLRGVSLLNYEQDLGISSLRYSKNSFRPKFFLKKYSIQRI